MWNEDREQCSLESDSRIRNFVRTYRSKVSALLVQLDEDSGEEDLDVLAESRIEVNFLCI